MILIKIDIQHTISITDQELDFLEIHGETEDQVDNWRNKKKAMIDDLMIRASREVFEKKAPTQSGSKKLAYPHFNEYVPNNLEFKK